MGEVLYRDERARVLTEIAVRQPPSEIALAMLWWKDLKPALDAEAIWPSAANRRVADSARARYLRALDALEQDVRGERRLE